MQDPFKRYTIEQALAHPWVSGGAAADTPLDRTLMTSLLVFNAKNRFKKEALKLVSSTLSAKEVAGMREAFNKIDTDQSGFVTYHELAAALRGLGMTNTAEIDTLMKNMDTDGDGQISWCVGMGLSVCGTCPTTPAPIPCVRFFCCCREEFLQATAEQQMIHHQNNVWWAFCEYDKDGDGKISVDELRLALKDEPEDVVRAYIREYDTDGDGTISYEEFIRMLLPKSLNFKLAAAVGASAAPSSSSTSAPSPQESAASSGRKTLTTNVTHVKPAA